MSDTKGQHEPSMEEILASIRRIIAEDGDGAAPAANGAAPPAAGTADAGDDEILELTDVVEPEGAAPAAKAEPDPEPIAIELPPPREPHRPKPEEPAVEEEPSGGEAPIVSAATAALSVAAMSRITELSQQRAERDIPLGAGQLTLETLVRQELRPILREWLDANLPDMVERIVKSEIARLVQNVSKR